MLPAPLGAARRGWRKKAGLTVAQSIEFGESIQPDAAPLAMTRSTSGGTRWPPLGFDERFRRMWNFYLTSCAATFSFRQYRCHADHGDAACVTPWSPLSPPDPAWFQQKLCDPAINAPQSGAFLACMFFPSHIDAGGASNRMPTASRLVGGGGVFRRRLAGGPAGHSRPCPRARPRPSFLLLTIALIGLWQGLVRGGPQCRAPVGRSATDCAPRSRVAFIGLLVFALRTMFIRSANLRYDGFWRGRRGRVGAVSSNTPCNR